MGTYLKNEGGGQIQDVESLSFRGTREGPRVSASWDWPSRMLTSLCSFPLQEGLVLTPTCQRILLLFPRSPHPSAGEEHVISRIFILSGMQMEYDGLESPLFCLKAKEFPQRPYAGFQFLKDKEIHTTKVIWCIMS